MPFITEELWQQFKSEHKNKSLSIMISEYPSSNTKRASKEYKDMEWVKEIISGIRNIRGEMRIKPSVKISALLQQGDIMTSEDLKILSTLFQNYQDLGLLSGITKKKNLLLLQ